MNNFECKCVLECGMGYTYHPFLCLSPPLAGGPLEGRALLAFFLHLWCLALGWHKASSTAGHTVGTMRVPKRAGISSQGFGDRWELNPEVTEREEFWGWARHTLPFPEEVKGAPRSKLLA